MLRGTDCDVCESATCRSSPEPPADLSGLCLLHSGALVLGENLAVPKQKGCSLDYTTELSEKFCLALDSGNQALWCLFSFKRSLQRDRNSSEGLRGACHWGSTHSALHWHFQGTGGFRPYVLYFCSPVKEVTKSSINKARSWLPGWNGDLQTPGDGKLFGDVAMWKLMAVLRQWFYLQQAQTRMRMLIL